MDITDIFRKFAANLACSEEENRILDQIMSDLADPEKVNIQLVDRGAPMWDLVRSNLPLIRGDMDKAARAGARGTAGSDCTPLLSDSLPRARGSADRAALNLRAGGHESVWEAVARELWSHAASVDTLMPAGVRLGGSRAKGTEVFFDYDVDAYFVFRHRGEAPPEDDVGAWMLALRLVPQVLGCVEAALTSGGLGPIELLDRRPRTLSFRYRGVNMDASVAIDGFPIGVLPFLSEPWQLEYAMPSLAARNVEYIRGLSPDAKATIRLLKVWRYATLKQLACQDGWGGPCGAVPFPPSCAFELEVILVEQAARELGQGLDCLNLLLGVFDHLQAFGCRLDGTEIAHWPRHDFLAWGLLLQSSLQRFCAYDKLKACAERAEQRLNRLWDAEPGEHVDPLEDLFGVSKFAQPIRERLAADLHWHGLVKD